jgi:hypothetical protein
MLYSVVDLETSISTRSSISKHLSVSIQSTPNRRHGGGSKRMPSSDGYKRDYDQEKKTSDARGEKPKRAARNRARTIMMNKGMVKKGDNLDVDHKKGVAAGNGESNLRAMPASKNRSYARDKNAGKK